MQTNILKLFLSSQELTFSQIAKKLGTPTNKLAYHLKQLLQKNLLKKENGSYELAKKSEPIVPYLSNKTSPLVVILIGIGDKQKCFLTIRAKKPFIGKLGLPGGRIQVGESIEAATKRIMKEKYAANIKLSKINSMTLEHVYSKGEVVHSFLLVFVTATTEEQLKYTRVRPNKEKIIKSDYELISKDFDKEISLPQIKHVP